MQENSWCYIFYLSHTTRLLDFENPGDFSEILALGSLLKSRLGEASCGLNPNSTVKLLSSLIFSASKVVTPGTFHRIAQIAL